MSIYAQFDEKGNQFQLASNRGWGDFSAWIATLDPNAYPLLSALCEGGTCEELRGLLAEIDSALSEGAPGPDETDIGNRLESAVMQSMAAEILLITNGIGSA